MTLALEPFVLVRIKTLNQPPEAYGDWGGDMRPPAIGDIGAVLDELKHPAGGPSKWVVECVESDGRTRWLCDFFADELEVVERPG